jgi:hypothetical protein
VSSRPVVLFSAAQLALAQLTNSALFDEEGNAFGDVKSSKSLNGQNGTRSNLIVLSGLVRWTWVQVGELTCIWSEKRFCLSWIALDVQAGVSSRGYRVLQCYTA